MANLPSFFPSRRPKIFNYIPRYWDPEKEEREQRIREIEKEMGMHEGEAYVPTIRKGQMRSYFHRKSTKRERASNIRVLILIILLVFVAYYLFLR
jgi:hypothetical protein